MGKREGKNLPASTLLLLATCRLLRWRLVLLLHGLPRSSLCLFLSNVFTSDRITISRCHVGSLMACRHASDHTEASPGNQVGKVEETSFHGWCAGNMGSWGACVGLGVAVLQKNGDSGSKRTFWCENLNLSAAIVKGLAALLHKPRRHWVLGRQAWNSVLEEAMLALIEN